MPTPAPTPALALPLPEPLRGAEDGGFTEHTIRVRWPEIARRILAENPDLPEAHAAAVQALADEIPEAPIRLLRDTHAPDAAAWNACIAPWVGRNWLEAPWFFGETYFYRRIAEAVAFFGPAPADPFRLQKRRGLETTRAALAGLAGRLEPLAARGRFEEDVFAGLLEAALWGNQSDLSLWPAGEGPGPQHADRAEARDHLLADDAPRAAAYLARRLAAEGPLRIDLIADNAGYELAEDLALADYLLATGAAAEVRVHAKLHPTFVSDAMVENVWETLHFLADEPSGAARSMAQRLGAARARGALRAAAHPYWTSPRAGWEMPADLRADLARAALVVGKGDANYRRFLGDRRWPPTTPFADIAAYAPAPLVLLRTLKSEIVAGLAPGQAEAAARRDPAWLTNGRWGVIQFHHPLPL